jgi:hypothetical protein
MVRSCVLDMRQEVSGAKKSLLLAVLEHGNEALRCHRHDAGNRISHVSRETLPPAQWVHGWPTLSFGRQ